MRYYLYRVCIVWALVFALVASWNVGDTERRQRRAQFALTCAVLAIALRKESA